MRTPSTLLCLIATGLVAQVKTSLPTAQASLQTTPTLRPMLSLTPQAKAELLAPGKTQGTFYLTGLVRKDRTVLLRWANTHGEMPTEGVRVFRQKVGDAAWKELTGGKLPGFLQGKVAEKRLNALPDEDREKILAYPYGDIQHDTTTRLRVALPDAAPKDGPKRGRDLTPEKSLQQFRSLRAQGKLSRHDLQLMHLRADMDTAMAEILGLTYTDDPGKGQFRYKIQIGLPEGGTAEVACAKTFTTTEPTPIPQPLNLSAASGNGEVLLNWDETPSDVIGGYDVFRAESPSGPWKKLNTDPVKKVQLELEDPETTLRRAVGVQDAMVRMLRPLPEAARTPQKIVEAHHQATAQMEQASALPTLSSASSKAIKDAVGAGRLRPGGLQAAKSVFTDSIRTAGNDLVNEKTYYYKVTAVDIGGQAQPMDTAPSVPGIPKDLEPPQVPGQPALKTARLAQADLRTAQAARLKEPRLAALNQAVAAKLPKDAPPLTPFMLQAQAAPTSKTSAALSPSAPTASGSASLNLADAKRQRLSALAATMPVGALQKAAQAAEIRSNLDGTVPPAQLAWTPSPDADLKGYEVHRAMGDGAFTKVADTTAPEWTDTDLQPGQLYRYAIASVDKLGNVSARSPEGRVEVRDSSLPGRLAVPQFTGTVAKDLPPLVPVRRLIRPADRVLASGALRAAKTPLQLSRAAEPTVTTFRAPKATSAPKAKTPLVASSAVKAGIGKDLLVAPTAEFSAASLQVKPTFKVVSRSFNPMLMAAMAPKELHVVLEWAKPVQGMPLEYVVQQAPQKMEVVSTPRPGVAFQPSFKAFEALQVPSLTASAAPASAPMLRAPVMAKPADAAPRGMVVATPALHAAAARGLVAHRDGGLVLAESRKDFRAAFTIKEGPGTFTRVNDAPIATERFVVTFPAEVAQYRGATFYFRIQAFTREFGHVVEGPVSAPIEVRLPDIVAPPSPEPGSIDLQEAGIDAFQVALDWNQDAAKDLAGTFVERQPMNYTLVEGEAKAGDPAGPVVRLTTAAVPGHAWTDLSPSAGYQRYTLRSVDTTGNVSDPKGYLDVFVPGENIPGAPTGVAVAGTSLTWKAGANTAGFTVWRSFTGEDADWQCISGILPASQTSFTLPAEGTLHVRVVGRSATGMHGTPSSALVRTP
jgi:fibronectin type 3 domain-containing protein